MKKFFVCVLLAVIGSALTFSAHGQPAKVDRYIFVNTSIPAKSLVVGARNNYGADISSWLQVGDTGTSKGLYMPISDTAKVVSPKPGTFIFNKDSMLYYHNGKLWKKAGT